MKTLSNHKRWQISAPRLSAGIARSLLRTSDLDQALQESAQLLAADLALDLVRIWLFRGVTLELVASAGRPIDDGNSLIAGGQFSVGYVARVARPFCTDNLRGDPRLHDKEWAHRNGLRAFAGIPILVGGKPEGILAAFDENPIPAATFEQLCEAGEDIALAIHRSHAERRNSISPDAQTESAIEPAIVITTPDGRIVDWSSAAEKLFGPSRREVFGLPIGEAIVFDQPISREEWDRLLACQDGATLVQMVRHRKNDRLLHVRMTIARFELGGSFRGAVVVVHDLAEADRLRQSSEHAKRAGIVGNFVGAITHDFNNLLTIIQGYSEIVDHSFSTNDRLNEVQIRECMAAMSKAAKQGESLVRQILDFGRNRPPVAVAVDLNAVIGDLEKSLLRMVREDIAVAVRKTSGLPAVVADASHIHQVLLNLVINACDAMPQGGSLTIETRYADSAEVRKYLPIAKVPSCFVMIAVSDTGTGMDEATRARIFESYFTTKVPDHGTGMGLSNAQMIVKQYGGLITVESTPGQGSTFRIFLPSNCEVQMITETLPIRSNPATGTETILIVEDTDAVRGLLYRVLRDQGYNVLLARDGVEAISALQSAKEPIDLVITDVIMPKMSGNAVALEFKKLMPEAKVLFVSGYPDDVVSRAGIDSTRYFLAKPFTNSRLVSKVRELLDESSSRLAMSALQ